MINVLWMYPDILNLHGDRANAHAFELVGKKLGLNVNIDRVDNLDEKIDFNKYDILLFNPGELKVIKDVVKVLNKQKKDLEKYINDNKVILTIGTSISIFGNDILRKDNTSFKGLNLIDVDIKERNTVIGDDLYFKFNDMEIMGCQIQMIDIDIKDEIPFGDIIYGYGNIGKKDEGIIKNNVICTNTLGPILVKNPWLCEYLFDIVIKNKDLKIDKNKVNYDLEMDSLNSCKEFINQKIKE